MRESCTDCYEKFHEFFAYNPQTGILYWRKVNTNRVRVGSAVGAIDIKSDGRKYLRTSLLGQKFYVHRIVVTMMCGSLSNDMLVDHRNGDGLDNRWDNLRYADACMNSANHRRKPKTSGCVGVSWWSTKKIWRARIHVNKEQVHLGDRKCLASAIALRKQAEEQYKWSR